MVSRWPLATLANELKILKPATRILIVSAGLGTKPFTRASSRSPPKKAFPPLTLTVSRSMIPPTSICSVASAS